MIKRRRPVESMKESSRRSSTISSGRSASTRSRSSSSSCPVEMSSSPDSARCTACSRRSIVTPKGLLFTAAESTYGPRYRAALRLPRSPVRGVETLRDLVPVDHVPPRLEVVRALVLVLEVVGVLPHVDPDQRRLSRGDRRVLVGRARHGELGAVVHQPGPAAAELPDARGVHLLLELVEPPEGLVDAVCQRA